MPTFEVDHDGANGVVGVRAEGCVCCADVAIREFPHIQRVVRFWFDLKPIFLCVTTTHSFLLSPHAYSDWFSGQDSLGMPAKHWGEGARTSPAASEEDSVRNEHYDEQLKIIIRLSA